MYGIFFTRCDCMFYVLHSLRNKTIIIFLQRIDFDGFLNTTLQDRVLQRSCNSIYVTQCLSLLKAMKTATVTMDIVDTVYTVSSCFAIAVGSQV